jgi:hypothetical protein
LVIHQKEVRLAANLAVLYVALAVAAGLVDSGGIPLAASSALKA